MVVDTAAEPGKSNPEVAPVATVTVTERTVLPPAPLQVSVKVLVLVSGPRVSLPDVALLPDQAPDAAQELAFVAVQLSVEDSLAFTLVGFAVSDSVGAGGGGVPETVTVADAFASPPGPVQVRE